MPRKKRLLLINPWICDFTACDFWLRPLGLLYLASIIRKFTRFQVSFLDLLDCSKLPARFDFQPKIRVDGRASFYKEEVAKPQVLSHIPRKFSRYGWPVALAEEHLKILPVPEVVLVTCAMTYWYPGVQLVCELVKKVFGRVPVILGGIYPTLCPEHAREKSGADMVISGRGENQILPALEQICGAGVICPEARGWCFSSLDSLPFPAYDLYQDRRVACLLSSRGCPFNCSYCASRLLNPRFEQREPEKVVEEILQLKKLGVRHIAFYDDALLINKENHLKKILERIISLGLDFNFHTPNGISPRSIDRETAFLMKKAGFVSIFLSLETADPEWLEKTGPKVDPADLEKAVILLEEAGYRRQEISVYVLVGHPLQTAEQVIESIRLVKKLGARPRLAYFSPVPGTRDWKQLLDSGKLPSDADPLLHNKLVFAYSWSQITPEDLEKIKIECRQS